MEKAFKDFEIWFVTGAQLLYGSPVHSSFTEATLSSK